MAVAITITNRTEALIPREFFKLSDKPKNEHSPRKRMRMMLFTNIALKKIKTGFN